MTTMPTTTRNAGRAGHGGRGQPAPGGGVSWRWLVGLRVLAGLREAFGEPAGQPCSAAVLEATDAVMAQLDQLDALGELLTEAGLHRCGPIRPGPCLATPVAS